MKYSIIEKVIAALLLIAGVINLYMQYNKLHELFEFQKPFFENLPIMHILLMTNGIVILDVMLFLSGIGLLLEKKIGWMASTITSCYIFVVQLNTILKSIYVIDVDLFYPAIWLLMSITFISIPVVLSLQPFRHKYNVNLKSYVIVSLVIALMIFNKFFLSDFLIQLLIVNNS